MTSFSTDSNTEQNPPIYLDTSLRSSTPSLDLLVVHKDGRIRCLSENLAVEHWVSAVELEGQNLEYMTTVNMEQARTGLLKNREDVLAILNNGSVSDSVMPPLLVLVTSSLNDTAQGSGLLQLISLARHYDNVEISSVPPHPSPPQYLLSIQLPHSKEVENDSSNYHLHKSSGRLYRYQSKAIAIYDLSALAPHLDQLMHTENKMQSCLRLSSSLLATSDSNLISVLDSRYFSVQAQEPLRKNTVRTTEDNEESFQLPESDTQLLSFFPSSRTIIALQKRTLLAFQLAGAGEHNSSPRDFKCGTLADALGRGGDFRLPKANGNEGVYIPRQLGKLVGIATSTKRWRKREVEFDALVRDGDVEGFDRCFSEALGLDVRDGELDIKAEKHISTPAKLTRHSYKISFILSRIFKLDRGISTESSEPQLELSCTILPTKTFQWLVVNNFLTQREVELALRLRGFLYPSQDLPPCSIIQAISKYDPSLQTLMFMLAESTPLTTQEIICAMRYSLTVLQQSHNLSNMQLITAEGEGVSDSESNIELPLANGNLNETSESPKPEQDADKAHDAHAVMRTCLARLSQYHDSDIHKAFQQELSSPILISLVDFLRAELAGGGWFSHYSDDTTLPQEQFSPHSSQITIIAKLLNRAIDCLGSSAWLLDPSASKESVNKIAFLKAEISAALEGIEEATYVQGLVHEVLLASKYAPRVPKFKMTNGVPEVNEIGMSLAKPITIAIGGSESNALPLGLKPADYIDTTTVGAGGEKRKRSMRDIGMLKSKKVEAYSFERILV